jgi:hypothetical protein
MPVYQGLTTPWIYDTIVRTMGVAFIAHVVFPAFTAGLAGIGGAAVVYLGLAGTVRLSQRYFPELVAPASAVRLAGSAAAGELPAVSERSVINSSKNINRLLLLKSTDKSLCSGCGERVEKSEQTALRLTDGFWHRDCWLADHERRQPELEAQKRRGDDRLMVAEMLLRQQERGGLGFESVAVLGSFGGYGVDNRASKSALDVDADNDCYPAHKRAITTMGYGVLCA